MLATDVVRQDRHESSGPAVVDMKPTEHVRDPIGLDGSMSMTGFAGTRCPISPVRPVLVEVPLVLAHKRCEMRIIDQQHEIDQLSSDAAHEPLRDRVHVRCANRRPDHLGADA